MTISLIRRAVMCTGIVALAISLVGQTAMAKKPPKPKVVDCAIGASVQAEVDKAKAGQLTTIFITGHFSQDELNGNLASAYLWRGVERYNDANHKQDYE